MNDRVRQMFAGRPIEQQFIAMALSAQLGEEKLEELLNTLEPQGPSGREEMFGRPLRFYSGMSKEQLKNLGLEDEQITEIYSALGVNESEETAEVEMGVDAGRAASAPIESADLASIPEESKPSAQLGRIVTEADASREDAVADSAKRSKVRAEARVEDTDLSEGVDVQAETPIDDGRKVASKKAK